MSTQPSHPERCEDRTQEVEPLHHRALVDDGQPAGRFAKGTNAPHKSKGGAYTYRRDVDSEYTSCAPRQCIEPVHIAPPIRASTPCRRRVHARQMYMCDAVSYHATTVPQNRPIPSAYAATHRRAWAYMSLWTYETPLVPWHEADQVGTAACFSTAWTCVRRCDPSAGVAGHAQGPFQRVR